MRILIVSTLKRKVTQFETASRSQIIFRIASGMAKKGHDVSLLGTGDSQIPGVKIIPVIKNGWVDLPPVENPFFRETATLVQLERKLVEIQNGFDIIHNHLYPEFLTSMVENEFRIPLLTTVHIQATDYIDETFSLFKKTKLIAISNAHRSLFKKTRFYKTIYNGIDTEIFSFREKKGDYLLWIGRLSKAKNSDGTFMDPKGVSWAIQLAEQTGSKLILTGNVEDRKFFEQAVKPHLNANIRWFGPVTEEQSLKREDVVKLYQDAKAFLMTVNWNEPFGLVMAEAMSCGTPVIGFDRGAVPELVVDGKTGFVVPPNQGLNGLKQALAKIASIDSRDCREHIVNNFSVEKMIENYEKTYFELIG